MRFPPFPSRSCVGASAVVDATAAHTAARDGPHAFARRDRFFPAPSADRAGAYTRSGVGAQAAGLARRSGQPGRQPAGHSEHRRARVKMAFCRSMWHGVGRRYVVTMGNAVICYLLRISCSCRLGMGDGVVRLV